MDYPSTQPKGVLRSLPMPIMQDSKCLFEAMMKTSKKVNQREMEGQQDPEKRNPQTHSELH
jgi:DNA-nicking Smr family endonuclease